MCEGDVGALLADFDRRSQNFTTAVSLDLQSGLNQDFKNCEQLQ